MIIINNSTNYIKYERESKIKTIAGTRAFTILIVNEKEHANLGYVRVDSCE